MKLDMALDKEHKGAFMFVENLNKFKGLKVS